MSFIQFILILSRSTPAKMKVILNSMKAGQADSWLRERESPVSVVDVGEKAEEDYRLLS